VSYGIPLNLDTYFISFSIHCLVLLDIYWTTVDNIFLLFFILVDLYIVHQNKNRIFLVENN